MRGLMQWSEEGSLRLMAQDGTRAESERDCERTSITFIAGAGMTDGTGNWKLDLSAVACEPIGLVRGVSVVATPVFPPEVEAPADDAPAGGADAPSYIQMGASGVGGGPLVLYARSWGCRCEAQPYTRFDYHVAIAHVFVTRE